MYFIYIFIFVYLLIIIEPLYVHGLSSFILKVGDRLYKLLMAQFKFIFYNIVDSDW